jgi:hypothetical protein
MKSIIIFAVLFVAWCRQDAQPAKNAPAIELSQVKIDTVPIVDHAAVDSLIHLSDSLRTQLFIAKYKIERVRYYVRIVDRNPSQKIFLKGWVTRAIK